MGQFLAENTLCSPGRSPRWNTEAKKREEPREPRSLLLKERASDITELRPSSMVEALATTPLLKSTQRRQQQQRPMRWLWPGSSSHPPPLSRKPPQRPHPSQPIIGAVAPNVFATIVTLVTSATAVSRRPIKIFWELCLWTEEVDTLCPTRGLRFAEWPLVLQMGTLYGSVGSRSFPLYN